MITDSTGNTVATYTYDPYGNNTATGSYAATNVMRYQASQQDNTGLYKFGDRYYDPTTQHWTQQDALAGNFNNPTSTNRYAYAGSSPIDRWDPTGRYSLDEFKADVGAVASFAGVGAAVGAGIGCVATIWIRDVTCVAGGAVSSIVDDSYGVIVGIGVVLAD